MNILLVLISAIILAAQSCSAPVASPSPAPASGSSNTASGPAGRGVSPDSAAMGNSVTITGKDNGKTVHAALGDTVLVSLGFDRLWQLQAPPDKNVLAPIIGVMWMRGTQNGWKAKGPGTVTLTYYGKNSTAAAGEMHATNVLVFKATVVVK